MKSSTINLDLYAEELEQIKDEFHNKGSISLGILLSNGTIIQKKFCFTELNIKASELWQHHNSPEYQPNIELTLKQVVEINK